MFLTKEQKERRVIDLYSQGKTYRQIAEEVRISPNDIHAILKKKEEEEKNNNAVTNNQKQRQELSSRAYKLFSAGKRLVQVAIILNLREPDAIKLYREYWRLKRMDILNFIYKETNGKLGPFLKLYKELIKKRRMSIEQVVNVVDIAIDKLPYMENLYVQAKYEAEKMQGTIQRLANDIAGLERKISILNNIAFSSEQDCRRKYQEIQELIAQKDRLEKLIANILNGEDYTKVNQIAKESVKVVLSDNKKLISISFAAVIQTLKDNPQMAKLIQNISCANNGEQHKDNHINITQYFESNKDHILNLGEKNYENLVEAFTKNAIDIAASASSSINPTLSLPQSSSSAFPSLSNQSDTHRIEDPNVYNNKDDIAY